MESVHTGHRKLKKPLARVLKTSWKVDYSMTKMEESQNLLLKPEPKSVVYPVYNFTTKVSGIPCILPCILLHDRDGKVMKFTNETLNKSQFSELPFICPESSK